MYARSAAPAPCRRRARSAQRRRPITEERGPSRAQLALARVLRHPNAASATVGATRVEQVEANAAAAGVRLDEEALQRIDAALEGVAQG